MDRLFEQFCKEKTYLDNVSPNTIDFYTYSYRAYKRTVGEIIPTTELLKQFIVGLRESRISTGAINCYARGMNSFLSWLHEGGHIPRLRIKLLKQEERVLKTFTDQDILKIVNWKPKSFSDCRLHTLLLTLADTGCRITELLTLKKTDVNLDEFVMNVKGKGDKERIVPFSIELRKHLYKLLKQHHHELVFCNRTGGRLLYDNTRRDFRRLCLKLGIEGFDASFHAFRRCYAKNYLRNGGNVFYLQKAMGHSRLDTTRKYVEVETSDLQKTHLKTSILSRLR